jgi:hypothetical protein
LTVSGFETGDIDLAREKAEVTVDDDAVEAVIKP